MDALELLLNEPYFQLDIPRMRWWPALALRRAFSMPRTKRPLLLLRSNDSQVDAAVLCFEYRLGGLATRCFIPFDEDGYRSVIAPHQLQAEVALQAGEALIRGGAMIVLLSYIDDDPTATEPLQMASHHLLGSQSRQVARKLVLAASLDQTLAAMSRSTRHNLRRAKRQIMEGLGAIFASDAVLTTPELIDLSRSSKFAPPFWAVQQRYETTRTSQTGITVGIRGKDGRWLSMLGAHREAGTLCLNWQLNRSDLGPISVATALRAFLIEDEIAKGTKFIRFERGTTHPIHRAFVEETTRELLFCSRFLPSWLLRRIFSGATGGLIPTALASKSLQWRR